MIQKSVLASPGCPLNEGFYEWGAGQARRDCWWPLWGSCSPPPPPPLFPSPSLARRLSFTTVLRGVVLLGDLPFLQRPTSSVDFNAAIRPVPAALRRFMDEIVKLIQVLIQHKHALLHDAEAVAPPSVVTCFPLFSCLYRLFQSSRCFRLFFPLWLTFCVEDRGLVTDTSPYCQGALSIAV